MCTVFRATTATIVLLVSSSAFAEVPYQWIAKQYSEGLGRAPDDGGWSVHESFFQASGCTHATLKEIGRNFLTSAEFESRGYNNAERVFVAYRAILSREPDQGGFDLHKNALDGGSLTWPQLIDGFYEGAEFDSLQPAICAGKNYRDDMGANQPIPIGGSRSQSILQAQLDQGGTVCLNPQEVVFLESTLRVPSHATFQTCGVDNRNQTAKFGRLIRNGTFVGYMVEIRGTVDKVWIDGQRGRLGPLLQVPNEDRGENVEILSGILTNSRIAEPRGWTNVQAVGCLSVGGTPSITNNLITAYTSQHRRVVDPADNELKGLWADGLSLACPWTSATGNEIIDATDVGIVLFARGSSGENITVQANKVVAAGRSAFGAYVICDAILEPSTTSCAGSVVNSNQLWTSPLTHFDIGISVGTQPWGPGTATGGRTINNFTPGNTQIFVKLGIVVDGVTNHEVAENGLWTATGATDSTCIREDAAAHDSENGNPSHGSHELIQPHGHPTNPDTELHGCIGAGEGQ